MRDTKITNTDVATMVYRDLNCGRMEVAQGGIFTEKRPPIPQALELSETAPTTTPSPSLTAGKTPSGGGASANLRLKDLHPKQAPKVSPSLLLGVTAEYQIQIQMSSEARNGSMRDTKITNTDVATMVYRDLNCGRMEVAQGGIFTEKRPPIPQALELYETAPTTTPSPSLTLTAGKTPGRGGTSANLRPKDLHPKQAPKVSPVSGPYYSE